MTINRRLFNAALASAGTVAALRAWALEPSPFEVMEFDWVDSQRQRPVPVRLYWPSGSSATASVPLVVFSHGIGGSRRGYRYLGEHWSANGVASLHLQHVGSDRGVWIGNPLGLLGRLHDAVRDSEAIERPRDLSFALDQLLGSALGERVDSTRIVAAGHSYGANTTLLAAGARVERSGRAVDLRDERLRAAIIVSAPPFYGEGDLSHILEPVRMPSLHITATGDVIRIPGYYSGADDRVAVFEAVGSRHKALAVFEGGSHSMFTDRAGTGGAQLNPQVKTATKELSLAFLQSVLGSADATALQRWSERYRPIVAKAVGLPGIG